MPTPRKKTAPGPTEEQARRQLEALELRRSGATYQAIADAVGYANASAAHKAVASAMRNAFLQPAKELRELEADRLDLLQTAIWPAAIKGDLKAVDRAIRIVEARAKLMGLNEPIKTEHTHKIEAGQAALILGAIRGILTDLNLTPQQETLSGEVVSRHLRAIESGTPDAAEAG